MTDVWLPDPSEESRPFFDGAKDNVLRLQKCGECGSWFFPLVSRCRDCGSMDIEWADASGRGTLWSHAKLHREYHPRHKGRTIILAIVDLEEGVRVQSGLTGVESEVESGVESEAGGGAKDGAENIAVRAGMPVEVTFETFPDGGVIPIFKPAASEKS